MLAILVIVHAGIRTNFVCHCEVILTLAIRDGRHAKHRQSGRVVFYATWGVFILYNATSQF